MKRNLAAIPTAVKSAAWLATHLNGIERLRTNPIIPPTNLFHLYITASPERVLAHACAWSSRHGVLLLPAPRSLPDGPSYYEFSIGRGIESASPAQWQAWLTDFFGGLR